VRDNNNEYYKIRDMIPASNPHRDDIVARMFEDLLSGNLERKKLRERAKDYVVEYNRMFPTMFAKLATAPWFHWTRRCLRMARQRAGTRSAAGFGIRRVRGVPKGSRFFPQIVESRSTAPEPIASQPADLLQVRRPVLNREVLTGPRSRRPKALYP
jgi:hypothetical protein